MDKKKYKEALERIVEYLTARGYTVNLNSNTFAIDEDENVISCPTKSQGTYSMICGLLHEAGHALQPPSRFLSLRKSNKRNGLIIAEQEYTAWNEGLNIAYQLNIIDNTLYIQYIKEWSRYWHSYLSSIYSLDYPSFIEEHIDSYIPDESRVIEK